MAHHDTVYVEEAKVPEGGFVVVHHLVDSDSDTGDEPAEAEPFQVIGHTPMLRPGEYENLPVRLHIDDHHTLNGPVPEDGRGITSCLRCHTRMTHTTGNTRLRTVTRHTGTMMARSSRIRPS